MALLAPAPKFYEHDANGNPLSLGKVYTYITGTTTPLDTYTDAGQGTTNTNPVTLDSAGRADIWLGNTNLYTFVVKDSAGALIYTVDGIGGAVTNPVSANISMGGYKLTGLAAGSASTDSVRYSQVFEGVTASEAACTGAITTSVVWRLLKTGNQVTLELPLTQGTASLAPSFAYGVAIPIAYRPTQDLTWTCAMTNNSAAQTDPGVIRITPSTGLIEVFRLGDYTSNFTAGAAAGLTYGTTVGWRL